MKVQLILCLALCFLMIACQNEGPDPKMVLGTWQADQFIEKGEPKDLDLSRMSFSFNEQNIYIYHANLNSREAGRYKVKGQYLYTTDTLDAQSLEKVVKISHLTTDSLHLTMNRGGTEQIIILHKKK